MLQPRNPNTNAAVTKAAELFSTNKRRNLTSSQWAAVAVEADEIIAAIKAKVEEERRENIAKARACETAQLIAPSEKDERSSAHQTAELFNTNRTYINDAKKLREASPEHFEKIKSGSATLKPPSWF